ncbi:MAG: uroporphyrinogen-III C-methyltransferase [Peptococcaceae bacterium]|nr:uroporphyrinogen-III C-methyltransferase [Peptococcaceae bacterium]
MSDHRPEHSPLTPKNADEEKLTQAPAGKDSSFRHNGHEKTPSRPEAGGPGPGQVSLVGAGPGDPGLITVKGLECIRSADYIIYDLLANPRLLEEAPGHCEKLYAGKKAGSHSLTQEEITELILDCARKGGHVVRLKGGDPYVFGRGGEEALRLAAEGIPFQVVPGVTAPVAGLCYAGIPITHRGKATSFHVITAHRTAGGIEPEECAGLAGLDGTLIFMMGLGQAENIAGGLLAGGMSPDTPAAVISKATLPGQQTLVSTLAELPRALKERPMPFPAMIVVGEVVGLRRELNFFEELPLFGKRVLVTRSSQKGSRLNRLLEEAGAEVIAAPVQELIPVPGALEESLNQLKAYSYILFTSTLTVELFFQALKVKGLDARALAGKTLCAVGRATAEGLEKQGLGADILPREYTAEGLFQELAPRLKPTDRVLLPQSAAARPYLQEKLTPLCSLEVAELYRPEEIRQAAARLEQLLEDAAGEPVDAAVFTSSAGVAGFCRLPKALELLEKAAIFSIGPLTSAALRKQGLKPRESRESTMSGLMEELCRWGREERNTPEAGKNEQI